MASTTTKFVHTQVVRTCCVTHYIEDSVGGMLRAEPGDFRTAYVSALVIMARMLDLEVDLPPEADEEVARIELHNIPALLS